MRKIILVVLSGVVMTVAVLVTSGHFTNETVSYCEEEVLFEGKLSPLEIANWDVLFIDREDTSTIKLLLHPDSSIEESERTANLVLANFLDLEDGQEIIFWYAYFQGNEFYHYSLPDNGKLYYARTSPRSTTQATITNWIHFALLYMSYPDNLYQIQIEHLRRLHQKYDNEDPAWERVDDDSLAQAAEPICGLFIDYTVPNVSA